MAKLPFESSSPRDLSKPCLFFFFLPSMETVLLGIVANKEP
jgi:hypothetical protein